MKYYFVAELEITDQSWIPTYVKDVTRLVEQRGGRFLARTTKAERIEGERKVPQIVLMVEWPSKDAAEAFYECDEYRPYRQVRIEGSTAEFLLVPGEDVTRSAQMAD